MLGRKNVERNRHNWEITGINIYMYEIKYNFLLTETTNYFD